MEVDQTGLSSLAGSTTKASSQDVGKLVKSGSCSTANPTGPDDTDSNEKCVSSEELQTTRKEKVQRMNDMPEGDDGWRAYYEHPLTAATTAMLNINGAGEEQNPGMGLLYEYYKLPPIDKQDKAPLPSLWNTTIAQSVASRAVPVTVTTIASATSSPGTTGENGQVELYLNRAEVEKSPSAETDANGDEAQEIRKSPHSVLSTAAGNEATEADEQQRQSPITMVVVKQELIESNPSSPLHGDIKSESFLGSPSQTPIDLVTSPLPPTAVAVTTPTPTSNAVSDEDAAKTGGTVISLSAASTSQPYTQVFANVSNGQPAYETLGLAQYSVLTNAVAIASTSPPPQYSNQNSSNSSRTVYALTTGDYYRDYYTADQYQTVRQQLGSYAESSDLVERYIRQNGSYKTSLHGLTVDLPSPDSGIGETTVTPRDGLPQMFDYSELSQTSALLQTSDPQTTPTSRPSSSQSQSSRRSWHDYGRNSDSDKVQIPKVHSELGFRYYLEAPISTSQRKEDDRITYINKGQFYGISLEYIPDPDRPLKNQTVKSTVLLVFREEKSAEEEMKAWQFWHSRQHSVKQRILDADTKNSSGIVGQIEEITHNGIVFYWNPLESPAKINVAVQCLSTDFSNQKGVKVGGAQCVNTAFSNLKGVKGLPLHLQIDTSDDYREGSLPIHRGYCQIKVFCDKGAERKTRDEERRAAKRRITATGSSRKKIEDMYHTACDRSEFYSMSDLLKPPMLFTPSEDLEKVNGIEMTFYTPHSVVTDEQTTTIDRREITETRPVPESPFPHPPIKRAKIYPPDRVLLYARREDEQIYHPLHLVPPNLAGLANAIENKYHISAKNIRNIFKKCKKGITVQMDDEIIKHYFNEDTFVIEVVKVDDCYDVTLVEL